VALLGTVFFGTGAPHALLIAAGMVVLTVIGAAVMVNGARRRSGGDQSLAEDSLESESVLSD